MRRIVDAKLRLRCYWIRRTTRWPYSVVFPCLSVSAHAEAPLKLCGNLRYYLTGLKHVQIRDGDVLFADQNVEPCHALKFFWASLINVDELDGGVGRALAVCYLWNQYLARLRANLHGIALCIRLRKPSRHEQEFEPLASSQLE